MTGQLALCRHAGVLEREDDFDGWRNTTRRFLTAGVPPDQIDWRVGGEASLGGAGIGNLFASETEPTPFAGKGRPMPVSRDLLDMLRAAMLHSAPDRFARGYRLMWRQHHEPSARNDPTDPDRIALLKFANAVRRDIHKMHAFVRFRKVGESGGREQFAAWFEPDHHIARAAAGFFRDRFANMDWLIVTPEVSLRWDGQSLSDGPGGQRGDVPAADAVEAEWRTYYASIFNPARLKVNAMKREMPVRYWRNLPEASLIANMVQDARRRTEQMVERSPPEPDIFGSLPVETPAAARGFDSLDALYAALRQEDAPPSPGFSDVIVPGEGSAHARLMVVGEQPGDQEDRMGRPFVGPAGNLLNACLDQAGIRRDDIFLTNAVKRFKFTQRGKKRMHQTPSSGDITHYRWWLAEEIRLVAPRIVIALGATALQALTGRKQALGPIRGEVRAWNDRCLLVTVHPSFLLRLPDEQGRRIEREKFVRDLSRAATALAGG